jgi:hypothetical protein
MDKDAISFRQRFSVRPMQGGNGFGLFMKDKLVGYANLKPGGPSGTPSFSYRYIHPSLQKLNLNNKFTGEILKRLPGGWTGTDLPMNYTPAGWKSLQKFIKQPSIEARPTYSLSAATDMAKQPLRHILHRLGLGPKPEPLPTYGDGSTYFLRMKSPGAKLPVPQEIAKNFPKAMQRDATRAVDTTTPAYDPAVTPVQGVLRVPKQGSVLDDLIRAKKESDRGNYGEKHSLLQKLLRMKLEEFDIDSQEGREVGLTHRPTRFRIHIPKKKLPDSVSLRKKEAQITPVPAGPRTEAQLRKMYKEVEQEEKQAFFWSRKPPSKPRIPTAEAEAEPELDKYHFAQGGGSASYWPDSPLDLPPSLMERLSGKIDFETRLTHSKQVRQNLLNLRQWARNLTPLGQWAKNPYIPFSSHRYVDKRDYRTRDVNEKQEELETFLRNKRKENQQPLLDAVKSVVGDSSSEQPGFLAEVEKTYGSPIKSVASLPLAKGLQKLYLPHAFTKLYEIDWAGRYKLRGRAAELPNPPNRYGFLRFENIPQEDLNTFAPKPTFREPPLESEWHKYRPDVAPPKDEPWTSAVWPFEQAFRDQREVDAQRAADAQEAARLAKQEVDRADREHQEALNDRSRIEETAERKRSLEIRAKQKAEENAPSMFDVTKWGPTQWGLGALGVGGAAAAAMALRSWWNNRQKKELEEERRWRLEQESD